LELPVTNSINAVVRRRVTDYSRIVVKDSVTVVNATCDKCTYKNARQWSVDKPVVIYIDRRPTARISKGYLV